LALKRFKNIKKLNKKIQLLMKNKLNCTAKHAREATSSLFEIVVVVAV